jgi:DNA-binding CsgD family transcriptional regulator/tetratricopeptide (TPR) repeat protein
MRVAVAWPHATLLPPPRLIERDAEVAALAACLSRLLRGQGGVVVITAASGGGKTSLLRHLAHGAADAGVACAWSACAPLLAPPPLAALQGLAPLAPPAVAQALRERRSDGEAIAQWLHWLHDVRRPMLALLDDLQWADSASTELLRYLLRRLRGAPLVLALAVRSGELPPAHPVRLLLGSLPADATTRLEPAPLSVQAVAELARGRAADPAALHRATGGNPFLVTEALASPGQVPLAVRQRLQQRIEPLPAALRALLDAVAAADGGLPLEMALATLGDAAPALDGCIDTGLLRIDTGRLVFEHDLLRQALIALWSPAQARSVHGALCAAWREQGEPPARWLPHAHAAGRAALVLEHAPAASRALLAAGARREAADLVDLVLPHLGTLPAPEQARLLAEHAAVQAQAQRLPAAVASRERALALHRGLGDTAAAGIDLRELARLRWLSGELAQALADGAQAVQLLQAAGLAHELAWAQAVMAQLHMLSRHVEDADRWAQPALAQFEAQGDVEGQVHTLDTIGFARRLREDSAAHRALSDRCIALAREHGLHEALARACTNAASLALVHRQLVELEAACTAGLAHTEAHDLDLYTSYLLLRRGWGQVLRGRWREGRATLAQVFEVPNLSPIEGRQARMLLALLSLREGGAGAAPTAPTAPAAGTADAVDARAWWRGALAGRHAPPVDAWFAPRAVLMAEAAWLLGDTERALAVIEAAWSEALAGGEGWRIGALAVWQQRCGGQPLAAPAGLPAPWAHELAGDADAAAAAWRERGCRHEAALALAHGANLAAALRELEGLGAHGVCDALRAQQRRRGGSAARGRGRHARSDPLGLTPRERAVFDALAEGLSNRAIAQRLQRSERTVEHHVAALLDKLGVASRSEAMRLAGR